MTFCYQCGKPIDEGSRFCTGCGALQKTADSFAPQEPSAPQDYAPQDYAPQDITPQDASYNAPQDYPLHDYTQQNYAPQDALYSAPQEPPYAPQQSSYAAPGSPYAPQQSQYPQQDPQRPGSSGYPIPESGSYYPGATSATKKKPSKFLLIGVPIIAVVVIAAAAFALFFFRTTPLIAASRALSNLGAEAAERIDSTPLKAVLMLSDTLKDGTLSVDFDYRNWYGSSTGGSVILSSNTEDRDFALSADITAAGDSFDMELFINKDRFAVGSSLIDSNYYGFRYGTFRSDIRKFGDLAEFDDETMDTLSDIVEMIGEMMNMEDASEDYIKSYSDVMNKFMKNCEVSSERDSVESGGSTTRCTRVDMVIPEDALFVLLEDYIQLIEDNEAFDKYLDMFNNELMRDAVGNVSSSYNDTIRELRRMSREFERYYSGDITISLFIGSRNRLLRAEFNADVKYDGDRTRVKGTFDFGESATERWTMSITVTSGSLRETVKVVWDYRERSNAIENTLTITSDDSDPVTLRSSWSPDRGNFTLSFEQYGDESEVSGVFKPSDDGFRLSFDNLFKDSYSDESLTFEINAKSGARIKQVDFVNVDKWDEEFIDNLSGLFGGAIATPVPPPGISGAAGYIEGYGGDAWVSQYTEFSFTPDYSGWWEIYTWDNGDSDPYIEVYDTRGGYVGSDDDGGGDYNAYVSVYLDAGELYKITVGFYSSGSNSCMLSVWQT